MKRAVHLPVILAAISACDRGPARYESAEVAIKDAQPHLVLRVAFQRAPQGDASHVAMSFTSSAFSGARSLSWPALATFDEVPGEELPQPGQSRQFWIPLPLERTIVREKGTGPTVTAKLFWGSDQAVDQREVSLAPLYRTKWYRGGD
jgi:hypothetical protein